MCICLRVARKVPIGKPTNGLNPGFPVTLSDVPLAQTAQKHPDIQVGGYWEPLKCQARDRVAIVIPYRDREYHLHVFLANIIPFLKWQQISFSIFVIHQAGNTLFNRGALVNVGYLEGRKIHNFTCLIMHDVDMLPLRLCNLYHCSPTGARHLGVSRNRNPPVPKYKDYIGGVMALSTNVFQRIHGLTNIMFGWGGEDTELHVRLTEERINISAYPAKVANYTMIDHERDPSNPKSHRSKKMNHEHAQYRKLDGYSTLMYDLISVEKAALYTNITVVFNGPLTGPKAEAESMLFFNSKRAEFAMKTYQKGAI